MKRASTDMARTLWGLTTERSPRNLSSSLELGCTSLSQLKYDTFVLDNGHSCAIVRVFAPASPF